MQNFHFCCKIKRKKPSEKEMQKGTYDMLELSYEQKRIVAKHGLVPTDYLLIRETPRHLIIQNRKTGEQARLEKVYKK